METTTEEEIIDASTSGALDGETVETTETNTQDPLKVELERVQQKTGKTEAEKAAFSLKKNAERAKELGIDVSEVLGLGTANAKTVTDDDDDKPVTIGMLKRMQGDNATKNALQLADAITDPTERELIKYHLENSIRSTGSPSEDLDLARSIVNAKKNTQILSMTTQKPVAKTHVSGGAPAKTDSKEPELSKDEITLMRFAGLTTEQVIAARPKS